MLPLPYSAAVVSQPVNTCIVISILIEVGDKVLQILWMGIYLLLFSTYVIRPVLIHNSDVFLKQIEKVDCKDQNIHIAVNPLMPIDPNCSSDLTL